jgi:hypothetical protein
MIEVSHFKKPQDEIHFCIKKDNDLCFILSWNETTRHDKVESKSMIDVSYLKKPQDKIHFCIKKDDDLYFTMSWSETTRHDKVEWKFII